MLVITDLGRGLLLGSIPLAAWFGWLTFTVGSLIGAFVVERAIKWIGLGGGVALGSLLWAIGSLCLPLAGLWDAGFLFAIGATFGASIK